MHFPQWVDDPRVDDHERAIRRLKYMIHNVAAKICQRPSIRAFSTHCGIDHSLLFYWINQGAISVWMAQRIETAAGVDKDGNKLLPVEFLTKPLEIT